MGKPSQPTPAAGGKCRDFRSWPDMKSGTCGTQRQNLYKLRVFDNAHEKYYGDNNRKFPKGLPSQKRMDYFENDKMMKSKDFTICCKWYPILNANVHIKYCDGEVQLRVKLHLPGNTAGAWREFSPPNHALMGSCNNLVRILALGFKYGGADFKRELRYQAKKMAAHVKKEKYDIYKKSHQHVKQENVKEVNKKVHLMDSRWKEVMAARDAQWTEGLTYRQQAWKSLAFKFCLIPAAFPMWVFMTPFFRMNRMFAVVVSYFFLPDTRSQYPWKLTMFAFVA